MSYGNSIYPAAMKFPRARWREKNLRNKKITTGTTRIRQGGGGKRGEPNPSIYHIFLSHIITLQRHTHHINSLEICFSH